MVGGGLKIIGEEMDPEEDSSGSDERQRWRTDGTLEEKSKWMIQGDKSGLWVISQGPPLLPLMGMKKYTTKLTRQLFWAVYGTSWDIHTGERSVVDEAAGRCFLSPDLRLKEEECSSSASAFQELMQQISCCFCKLNTFSTFLHVSWTRFFFF